MAATTKKAAERLKTHGCFYFVPCRKSVVGGNHGTFCSKYLHAQHELGTSWDELVPAGTSWYPAGTSWYQLVLAGISWYQLVPAGTRWFREAFREAFWEALGNAQDIGLFLYGCALERSEPRSGTPSM